MEPVDLVICKDVFPYINPTKFQAVWKKIHDHFLKKGGYLMASIFSHDPSPTKLTMINQLKELGAWVLPDKRLLLSMLEGTGYTLEKTYVILQFSAQKT